jgi:ketosteroid isomerase-like protein
MEHTEQAILAADDARIAAAKNSDAAALDAIYADEFQLITHNGLLRGKRDQVNDYKSGALRYVSFELLERKIQVLAGVAVMLSRERSVILYHGSQDVGGDRRVTRVWVLRNGRWQLLLAHASAISVDSN